MISTTFFRAAENYRVIIKDLLGPGSSHYITLGASDGVVDLQAFAGVTLDKIKESKDVAVNVANGWLVPVPAGEAQETIPEPRVPVLEATTLLEPTMKPIPATPLEPVNRPATLRALLKFPGMTKQIAERLVNSGITSIQHLLYQGEGHLVLMTGVTQETAERWVVYARQALEQEKTVDADEAATLGSVPLPKTP